MNWHLTIDPENEKRFGPCECCGNMTRRVWGDASYDGTMIAAYYVEWTPGHMANGANFDLIIGYWGDDVGPEYRHAIALLFKQFKTGGQFMVIDAATRSFSKSELVGHVLERQQVIGQPFAQTIFAICDTIFLEDERIAELHSAPIVH